MSDRLSAAIREAMDGECELEVVEVAPLYSGLPDEAVICATHGCEWDDDEPIPCYEHRQIAAAVRAGWCAALEAATEVMHTSEKFTASDGYPSVALLDDDAVRAQISALRLSATEDGAP